MRLRRYMCVVMVLGLLLVATSAIGADKPPKLRPFWGNLTGEATFLFGSEACSEVTGIPVQTLTATEGRMTHLGRTALSTAHCPTADGHAVLGEATFTAANGDEVWATYTAIMVEPPPMIVQEADFIIVGGTGRFEHASGHLLGMVYVTAGEFDDPWPLRFVFAGTIAY